MGVTLTTSLFKERMSTINPDIDIIGEYVSAKTKIQCYCKKCGFEWLASPSNMTRKRGCPKCAKRWRRTQDEFVDEMGKINQDIIILGKYKTQREHVDVKCKNCGHTWSPAAGSLLSGSGCPNCRSLNNAKRFAMPEEEFLKRVSRNCPNVEVLSEYKNCHTKIECKCKACGYEWSASAGSLLSGSGCPACAGNMKQTHETFVIRLSEILPNTIVKSTYKNMQTRVLCQCKLCGHEWNGLPYNLLQKEGCPACAQAQRTLKQTKTHEVFISELRSLTTSIEVIGKYINAHTKIKCRCKHCGNEWEPLPMDLVRGSGCPECCHTSTSFMEQVILLSFRHALGDHVVISRDKKTIGMELDIYIPDYKLAIEPGAWRWHADKQENDLKKREVCRCNGIRLITIYDSYPFKEMPFEDNCFVFKNNVATEKNHLSIRRVIERIFHKYEISYQIDDVEWGKIEEEAFKKSRKITTEDFATKLRAINTKIDIIGKYKNSQTGIECKCMVCGHVWSPRPSHLLRGEGCPKCAGHMRKSHAEFVTNLKIKNPSILVLGKYQKSRIPILVRCNVCGYEWMARPDSLLCERGCAKCATIEDKGRIKARYKKIIYPATTVEEQSA